MDLVFEYKEQSTVLYRRMNAAKKYLAKLFFHLQIQCKLSGLLKITT